MSVLDTENSFFDLLESKQPTPCPFQWSYSSLLPPDISEIYIYGSELITLGEFHTNPEKKMYVLTLAGLIKCEDLIQDTPVNVLGTLPLKNPRMKKVEDRDLCLYGFSIEGYKGSHTFYCDSRDKRKEWIKHLKKFCVMPNIKGKYTFQELLGRGSFARVHLTTRKNDEGKFAVKTVEKSKILAKERNMQCFIKEIDILRRVNHPNIIKFYELYESEMYVHLVLEYLKSGDLLSHLQSKGVYSEKDASLVIRRVLEALDYCHSRNIIHRDLKLENLIVTKRFIQNRNPEKDYELKIADFGLATIIDPSVPETMSCGSPGYVAPEILHKKGYDTKADIFSAGVILYIILTGTAPFQGKNVHEMLAKNKECKISFDSPFWEQISSEGKDLVKRMLEVEPASRITAKEALAHPWFTLEHTSSSVLSIAQENMRKYCNEKFFNVGKIKPEFSMITCSPLLNSRFAGIKDSPLILSGPQSRRTSPLNRFATYRNGQIIQQEESKFQSAFNGVLLMRNIKEKHNTIRKAEVTLTPEIKSIPILGNEDDAADFNEKDISEKTAEFSKALSTSLNRSCVPKGRPEKPRISKSYRGVKPIQLVSIPETDRQNLYKPAKIGYSAPPASTQRGYSMGLAAVEYDEENFRTAIDNTDSVNCLENKEVENFVTAVNGECEEAYKDQIKETNDTTPLSINCSAKFIQEAYKHTPPRVIYLKPKGTIKKQIPLMTPKKNI